VRWILLVIARSLLLSRSFIGVKILLRTHEVCIRYKKKKKTRGILHLRAFYISFTPYIVRAFLYPSSSHIVMDIKCPQNTLRTFME
jgi:hypothetical protein